ncbi:MAG: hypothetical protein AAB194_03900 [Pseudomonadota bacterium]
MHRVTSCLMAAGLMLLAASAGAREDTRSVQVNEDQVQRLNAFVDKLHRLHQQQLQGRKIREAEQLGGYARLPEFYREVSYFDADSGRLLSRIQWERANPDRIHGIEVYVYDDRGRVARDYMAWYLPHYRNAPRQTSVNLHHYEGDLHGWRQFDGVGTRTYEKCTRVPGEKLVFELTEERIEQAEDTPGSVAHGQDYKRCFRGLGKTAGRYLTPQ